MDRLCHKSPPIHPVSQQNHFITNDKFFYSFPVLIDQEGPAAIMYQQPSYFGNAPIAEA